FTSSLISCRNALVSEAALSTVITIPFFSVTKSTTHPARLDTITGNPAHIASFTTKPQASLSVGNTNTSANENTPGKSLWFTNPANTTPSEPQVLASSLNSRSIWPEPRRRAVQ